jgi:glycosyltransferase involved in cell wall biosynthesis
MRILLISERCPTNFRTDVFGAFQRLSMLVDGLRDMGDVDALFFQRRSVDTSSQARAEFEDALSVHWGTPRLRVFFTDWTGHEPLRATWRRVPFVARMMTLGAVTFQSERLALETSYPVHMAAVQRCLERQPDFILAHRIGSMAPLLSMSRSLPPILFDLDDVEHVKASRLAARRTGRERLALRASIPILRWSERLAMLKARCTFLASEVDRQLFRRSRVFERLVVVPNAVTVHALDELPEEPVLLFLGTYVYGPNADAAEFLVREIWPRVLERIPKARLLIAGAQPERIPSFRLGPPGVEFLGFVDDLAVLYRRTRVVCCPILAGAGTRIKILEAAGRGRPVVSTTIGTEGLEFADGREILVRDDAASFANACTELLSDGSLCERLRTAARQAVAERYERSRIAGGLTKTIGEVLG